MAQRIIQTDETLPVAQAIPGATFKVLPVGHYAGLQQPELMAQEIGAFLDGVGA